jgi:GntR family transcriptional regulator/MocR family aminotransferase
MSEALFSLLGIPLKAGAAIDRQLAQRLRSAIAAGTVQSGTRLPPSRELALQLGVGRNSVVAAYACGVDEGWLAGRGRLGTFVAESAGLRVRKSSSASPGLPALTRRLVSPAPMEVPPYADWRLGQAGTMALPLRVWRSACKEAGRHLLPSGYGDPRGELALRQGIARWLLTSRGIDVSPQQVIVTQGASQAIEQLAALLLRPGDLCAVENPGYARAARIFAAAGASILAVPVDAEGAQADTAFAGPRMPALVHLTPAQHYPLGMRLSGPRRAKLLALARRHGTLVLENEYDHEFIPPGPRHVSLFASAPHQTVLVSTFAKAISPALRLGFVVASESVADRLADAVADERMQVSWPVQRSVAWLLESGELERHLRRVRRRGQRLRDELADPLRRWQERFGLTAQGGGQHLLLRASSAKRSRSLQRALQQAGIRFDALETYAIGPSPWHGLLLSYGHMSIADLRKAAACLDAALEAVG